MCLGHALCVAGGYAVSLRYRYPIPRSSKVGWKLIACVVVCGMTTFTAACLNFSAIRAHRWPSPLTCNGGNEVPFASPGYNIPSVIIPILSAASIVSAAWPVHKRRPKLWWRCSVVIIFVWEVGGIAVVESALVLYPGYDPNYGSEATKWTLGQMLSVLGVMVMILDLIQHAWKHRNSGRSRSGLSTFDTSSPSSVRSNSQTFDGVAKPLQRSTTWPYHLL
jgi:hypothetical protein